LNQFHRNRKEVAICGFSFILANQRKLVEKSGITIFYLLSQKKLENIKKANYNTGFEFLRIF